MMNATSALAAIACVCGLTGCALMKKTPVAAPPPTSAVPEGVATAPEVITKPLEDDGFRTGDLLVMPRETEYRATNPALPKAEAGAGTVIVTPPSAPKTRPTGKPEE